jgi:hypothetical protein
MGAPGEPVERDQVTVRRPGRSGIRVWPPIRELAGTICGMQKTTVYLEDGQAHALRRLAHETGRSQAELIREAVGRVTQEHPKRKLSFIGVGRGNGKGVGRNSRQILREEFPRRKPR